MGESMAVAELVTILDKIAARGSHGVLLKAPNDARVVDASEGLGLNVATAAVVLERLRQ
jgi:hypothetical protein